MIDPTVCDVASLQVAINAAAMSGAVVGVVAGVAAAFAAAWAMSAWVERRAAVMDLGDERG